MIRHPGISEPSRIGSYVGAGAGLTLFALFGFLPSSFLGGLAGINLAGWIFGMPVRDGIVTRFLVGGTMVLGPVAGMVIALTLGTSLGRAAGQTLSTIYETLRIDRGRESEKAPQRCPRRVAAGIVGFLLADDFLLHGSKRNVSDGGMGVTFPSNASLQPGDVLLMDDGTATGRYLRVVWLKPSVDGLDAGLCYIGR